MKKFLGFLALGLLISISTVYAGCKDNIDFEFTKEKSQYRFYFKNKSSNVIDITELYILTKDKKIVWLLKPKERKDLSYPQNQRIILVKPYRVGNYWADLYDLNPDLKVHLGIYTCEYTYKEKTLDKKNFLKKLKKIEKKPWWKFW